MAGWTLTMLIFWFLLPLEICLLGGKLFRPEIQNQTWSTLLTLPQSLSQLVYSKLGGAVLGLIPTVTVLCVSLIPNLADMTRGLSQGSGFSLGPLLVIAYFYSAVILAAHLSAYFSVVLNWAVPLIAVVCGAGVSYLGNLLVLIMFMIASVGFSFGGDAVGYILMAAVILGNLGLAGVVHAAIGQQLVAKGAQS